MAKVKIQGHASGTGILTVTAPNTSTDRTITLPDSTDTLAVNSDVTNKLPLAGGTLTGNTTIATNSVPTLALKRTGNNAGNGYIECHGADDSVDYAIRFAQTNGVMSFDNGGSRIMGVTADGLTFGSDTAAANALDDYEEGTWSPDMKGNSGSAGSAADNGGGGFYVKVGNLVYVSCQLYMTNKGSYSGNLVVEGLPFTAGYISSGSITSFPSTEVDAEMRGLGVPANYSRFEFFKGSRLDLRVPWSEVVTSYYLTVSATYRV